MKALITSGGTKVPLDDVRYIANFSKGGFGAKLARSLIRKAKAAQPGGFVRHFRCKDTPDATMALGSYTETSQYLRDSTFWSYDDYYKGIKNLLAYEGYNIVFLAAAVSDYTCKPFAGKMSSSGEVNLTLTPTEKIISKVRKWAEEAGQPSFIQVGFKLVAGDTSISDMLEIAQRAAIANDSDYTVANHMNDLGTKYVIRRKDGRIIHFVNQEEYVGEQADKIVDCILNLEGR